MMMAYIITTAGSGRDDSTAAGAGWLGWYWMVGQDETEKGRNYFSCCINSSLGLSTVGPFLSGWLALVLLVLGGYEIPIGANLVTHTYIAGSVGLLYSTVVAPLVPVPVSVSAGDNDTNQGALGQSSMTGDWNVDEMDNVLS